MAEKLAQIRRDEYPKLFEAMESLYLDYGNVDPPECGIYYVPARYGLVLEDFEAALSTLNHLAEVGEYSEFELFLNGYEVQRGEILAAKPHLADVDEFRDDYVNDWWRK